MIQYQQSLPESQTMIISGAAIFIYPACSSDLYFKNACLTDSCGLLSASDTLCSGYSCLMKDGEYQCDCPGNLDSHNQCIGCESAYVNVSESECYPEVSNAHGTCWKEDGKVYCTCDPGWMNVDCSINKVTYGVCCLCIIVVLFVILAVSFISLRSLSDK